MQCIVERELNSYQRQIDAEELRQRQVESAIEEWMDEARRAISEPAFKFVEFCVDLTMSAESSAISRLHLNNWILTQLMARSDQHVIDAAEPGADND